MSDSPPIWPRLFFAAPWRLFAAGLATVPCIFTIANTTSRHGWDWNTSIFGGLFAIPLLFLSLCCCLAPAFQRSISLGMRLLWATCGLLAFAMVLIASLVVSIRVFGIGIS